VKRGVELTNEEARLCLIAVDELIRKWENLGVNVGYSWYSLKEKLESAER